MIKSSKMSWIVVSDIGKARKFFTEKVGLKELEYSEEFKWLELDGSEQDGARLGIAQQNDDMQAGQGAIVTFTVENVDTARTDLEKKGVELIGEIIEVPGHVRMQMFADDDGNKFQIVQML